MKFALILFIGISLACKDDSDCSANKVCSDGDCQRKGVFPLTGYEILGTCLVFAASGLSSAAGIGGGVLYVVFYVTLFLLNSSEAVALSQFTIVGTTIMSSSIKLFIRHPTKNKPLIDFDIIIVIINPLLIGTTIGVIVNLVLPYWLILLLLTGILGYLSVQICKGGISLFKKESGRVSDAALIKPEVEISSSEELEHYLLQEKRIVPLDSLLIISAVYLTVVAVSLMQGSRSFPSIIGISFCSAWYWVLVTVMLLFLCYFTYFNSNYIIRKYKYKAMIGYHFDSGDIKWEKNTCIRLNIVGFISGILGAITGVGGALIVNPSLISYGVRPEVMAATSSFMILFTSTISALQFLIAGKIQVDYGLWAISFSLLGSAMGVFVIKGCVDRFKRSSLVTLTLAGVMIISGILTPIYGIIDSLGNDYTDYGFHNYC